MRVLLDTSAYSKLERGNEQVAELVRRADEVLFSAIMVGELLAGFRSGRHYQLNVETLHSFLDAPHVKIASIGMTTADRYSRIAASQRAKGRPIPTNDMWIAAHAMETGADLISADRHFEYVDGIVLVRIGY